MTEDEAKTKWCPQTLHARRIVGEYVEQTEMVGGYCQGSACMIWRQIWDNQAGMYGNEGFCGLGGARS